MATVTVLTAARLSLRRLRSTLIRVAPVTQDDGLLRVSSPDAWVDVTLLTSRPGGVSAEVIDTARTLLGRPPRTFLRCSFDGPIGLTDAWPLVVDIARTVAKAVPLAVLDDGQGTVYLVHPGIGLIGPDDYQQARRPSPAADFFRRLLGDDR
jgi:hypothetical protein